MTNFNHPEYRLTGPPVDPSAVADIAEKAIGHRLGKQYVADYGTRGCLRNVHPDGHQAVVVHLNSGGNAAAVESALGREGYAVSHGPRPDYGVVLIVTSGKAPHRQGGL